MKRLLHALAVLWLLPPRTGPSPCESADLPIRKIIQSPPSELADQQISGSTKENDPTTKTIFHLDRRYCNVLAYMALFMCLTAAKQVSAQAEPAAAAIQPLQIGDTIPEYLWHMPLQVVNHPEGKETITLNDYRGRLIILDFWATWCGSCIAAMPKMHAIQKEFWEQLVVLPVTHEPLETAKRFLDTNPRIKELQMQSLAGTPDFFQFFDHRILPHYVWITPVGQITLMTAQNQVTPSNIHAVIEETSHDIKLKHDIDPTKTPFLDEGPLTQNDIIQYSLLFTGYYDGLPSGPKFIWDQEQLVGLNLTNLTLGRMYDIIAVNIFEEYGHHYSPKRKIMEFDVDERDNDYFTYINRVFSSDSRAVYERVLQDLNENTAYCAKIEFREIDCMVLKVTDRVILDTSGVITERDHVYKSGGKHILTNYTSQNFVKRINALKNIPFLIIDGVHGTIGGDIEITTSSDELQLIMELKNQGLVLEPSTKNLAVLVVSRK